MKSFYCSLLNRICMFSGGVSDAINIFGCEIEYTINRTDHILQVRDQLATGGLESLESQIPRTDLKDNTQCISDYYTVDDN